jgi:hypothetical protein
MRVQNASENRKPDSIICSSRDDSITELGRDRRHASAHSSIWSLVPPLLLEKYDFKYNSFILHFYDHFLLGNPDRLSPGFSRDTDQQLIGLS